MKFPLNDTGSKFIYDCRDFTLLATHVPRPLGRFCDVLLARISTLLTAVTLSAGTGTLEEGHSLRSFWYETAYAGVRRPTVAVRVAAAGNVLSTIIPRNFLK